MPNQTARTYNFRLIGAQPEPSDTLAALTQVLDEHWVDALKGIIAEFSTLHDPSGSVMSTKDVQEQCGDLLSFQICIGTKGDFDRKEKVIAMLKQVEKNAVHQILIDNQPSTDPEDCPMMLLDCSLGDFTKEGDDGYLLLNVKRCETSVAVTKFSVAVYEEHKKEA